MMRKSLTIAYLTLALDGDPLRHPPGRRELAARLQRSLGDQGEDDPLDGVAAGWPGWCPRSPGS
jgi:hypothetical protein